MIQDAEVVDRMERLTKFDRVQETISGEKLTGRIINKIPGYSFVEMDGGEFVCKFKDKHLKEIDKEG